MSEDYHAFKERQYDQLADTLREYLNMEEIYGCLEKPIWNKYTKEELEQISIPKPMEEVRKQVLHNWDAIAKPIDGLGSFETLTAQIGAITGEEKIDISKKPC